MLGDFATASAIDEDGLVYDSIKLAQFRRCRDGKAPSRRLLLFVAFLLVALPGGFVGDLVKLHYSVRRYRCRRLFVSKARPRAGNRQAVSPGDLHRRKDGKDKLT